MNRLLASIGLPVVYDSVDDLERRRRRLEACLLELARQAETIDTTDTPAPTSFHLAYQGCNDREVMQQYARVLRGVDTCSASPHLASIPRGVTWRDLTARAAARSKQRIRVGFLSHHVRDHTIGHLNLECIRRLSRDDFEVVILSAGKYHVSDPASRHHDVVARAFFETADRFVHVSPQIAVLRRQIAEQNLDLLFFTDVGIWTR